MCAEELVRDPRPADGPSVAPPDRGWSRCAANHRGGSAGPSSVASRCSSATVPCVCVTRKVTHGQGPFPGVREAGRRSRSSASPRSPSTRSSPVAEARRSIPPGRRARGQRVAARVTQSRRRAHGARRHRARHRERSSPIKAAPVVLYCGGGFRSALAAESIQKMGYEERALHGRRLVRVARARRVRRS